jgi:hypothetical protein
LLFLTPRVRNPGHHDAAESAIPLAKPGERVFRGTVQPLLLQRGVIRLFRTATVNTSNDQTLRTFTPAFTAVEREVAVASLLLALLSFVRVLCVFLYRIDSDEPQHLHVVWGWAAGLRPYRDVFDNHLPLFHFITAPLFRLLPQSAQILTAARLAMLPIGFASIALTAVLGWQVAGRKGFAWAAVLASACPPLVLKTLEFRNDTLWCALLLAAMALLLARPSRSRSVAIGVLSALALLTSVKTVVIALAVLLALATERLRRGGAVKRREVALFACAIAGGLLPLVITAILLARSGILGDFLYGAFGYNFLFRVHAARRIAGLVLLPLLVLFIGRNAYRLDDRSRPFRLVALTIGYFVVVLLCLWPVITTRDFLPIFPLLAVLAAIWFTESRSRFELLPAVAIAGMLATLFHGDLWRPRSAEPQRIIADVLRLTSPTDYVMDLKGETIFRRRPVPIILEVVGRDLLRRGVIKDTIAAEMIRTRTCVAVRDLGAFPPDASRFLRENFVDAGSVRVCGKHLARVAAGTDVTFTLAIPARYAVRSREPVNGAMLDGQPFTEPRWLDAGRHTFRVAGDADDVTIIWEKALALGS